MDTSIIIVPIIAASVAVVAFGFGKTASFVAVTHNEIAEFAMRADPHCATPPHAPDFGPPDHCGHAPSPHSRSVFLASLMSGTSTVSMFKSDYVNVDLDHYQLHDPKSPLTSQST